MLWDATFRILSCLGACVVWLAEVVWDGLPEWVRVPYVKTMRCVLLFSRVAAGP